MTNATISDPSYWKYLAMYKKESVSTKRLMVNMKRDEYTNTVLFTKNTLTKLRIMYTLMDLCWFMSFDLYFSSSMISSLVLPELLLMCIWSYI